MDLSDGKLELVLHTDAERCRLTVWRGVTGAGAGGATFLVGIARPLLIAWGDPIMVFRDQSYCIGESRSRSVTLMERAMSVIDELKTAAQQRWQGAEELAQETTHGSE